MSYWTALKAVPAGIGLIAAVALARTAVRAGSQPRAAVGGGLLLGGGIVLVFLMTVHTVAVPLFRYLEPSRVFISPGRSVSFAGIRYDFRLYSLMLMGIVMLRYSAACIRSAPDIARGEPGARRTAWTATLMLCVLTAPLIPLTFEAWIYAATLLVNVAALTIANVPPRGLPGPRQWRTSNRRIIVEPVLEPRRVIIKPAAPRTGGGDEG